MTISIVFGVSLMSLVLSIATLVLRGGIWGGTTQEHVAQLIKEIEILRSWRHKIGDEPGLSLLKLYQRQERDLEKLAQRIEDMQYFQGPDRRRHRIPPPTNDD